MSTNRTLLALLLSMILATPASADPASPQIRRTLARAAAQQVGVTLLYDPAYARLRYPNGDLPVTRGVCADVVVRAFRKIGVDLQVEVHEDMKRSFAAYPHSWGLTAPDSNIDHRRVPNLMTFFARRGKQLPSTTTPADYTPGDIVTWDLGAGLTHIGIVVDVPSTEDPARWQIMHNIGAGPQIQDALFSWQITGHYRYTGPPPPPPTRRERRNGRS